MDSVDSLSVGGDVSSPRGPPNLVTQLAGPSRDKTPDDELGVDAFLDNIMNSMIPPVVNSNSNTNEEDDSKSDISSLRILKTLKTY